jgi:hypothetical protein
LFATTGFDSQYLVLLVKSDKLLETTTSEKKNGFLVIEVFRKLVNPKNYGHQGTILGGHFL